MTTSRGIEAEDELVAVDHADGAKWPTVGRLLLPVLWSCRALPLPMPAESSMARNVTALVPSVSSQGMPTSLGSVAVAPASKPLLSRSPSPKPSVKMIAAEAVLKENDRYAECRRRPGDERPELVDLH